MGSYEDQDASEEGPYRYWLSRRLREGNDTVLFVGLNPSVANKDRDDHTIRRCVGFARAWGYRELYMGNLHAWRDTDPKQIPVDSMTAVGPRNRETLERLVERAKIVIVAWGRHRLNAEAQKLADWLLSLPKTHMLGLNRNGTPRHPRCVPKTGEPLKVPKRE
jgi:hypothetical protein